MTSRIVAALALCASLAFAAAPAAGDGEPAHPLSSDWLTAPLLPGPSASTCRVDDTGRRSARGQTAEKIARARAMLAAEAAASGEGGVVVLNNRGYNYGSSAVVDPGLVEFEAQQRLAR
jgi:hypothetical protein